MTDTTSLRPARSGLTGNILGAVSMMVWAAGFPAADLIMQSWDPVTAVTGRVTFATLPLVLLWLILEPQGWRLPGWSRAIWVGGIGFGGGAITIILAQWYTDPVTVAIIAASSPLCATIVEWFAERTRLSRPFIFGLILSVIGGAVATGGGVPGNLGLGALFALASCLLFSWGSYRTVRDLPRHSVLGQTAATLVGALVFLWAGLALSLAMGWTTLPDTLLDPRNLGLLVIYGTGAMAVSQFLWIAAVQRLGVSIASFHINIAPFYVMIFMLALGGSWSWHQVIGAAIVAFGVVAAQRRSV